MTDKKQIHDKKEVYIHRGIDELIYELNEQKDTIIALGGTNLSVDLENVYNEYEDTPRPTLYITFKREETDSEYENRLGREDENKAARLRQYNLLKTEFDGE